MKNLTGLICAILFFTSCQDDIDFDQGVDSLVIGIYDLYCPPPCQIFYKIEDSNLHMGQQKYSGVGFHPFNVFTTLPDNKFQIVKDLHQEIPSKLLSDPNTRIGGQPYISDKGIYYIELRSGDFHRYWQIERGAVLHPVYEDLVQKLDEVWLLLQ